MPPPPPRKPKAKPAEYDYQTLDLDDEDPFDDQHYQEDRRQQPPQVSRKAMVFEPHADDDPEDSAGEDSQGPYTLTEEQLREMFPPSQRDPQPAKRPKTPSKSVEFKKEEKTLGSALPKLEPKREGPPKAEKSAYEKALDFALQRSPYGVQG